MEKGFWRNPSPFRTSRAFIILDTGTKATEYLASTGGQGEDSQEEDPSHAAWDLLVVVGRRTGTARIGTDSEFAAAVQRRVTKLLGPTTIIHHSFDATMAPLEEPQSSFRSLRRFLARGSCILIPLALISPSPVKCFAIHQRLPLGSRQAPPLGQAVTVAAASISSESTATFTNPQSAEAVLESLRSVADESRDYASSFELGDFEADTFALVRAIRASVPLGLKSQPFVLRREQIAQALNRNQDDNYYNNWFTLEDLSHAVQDDFLDAALGSTNPQKPWQISAVSIPKGDSLEQARMTYDDILTALDKGTVILNAAGAHIPQLAGPSLAATDAASLPCALNLYVTAAQRRTSAPPHTDKQDVLVMQTSGGKHWRVFSVPDPSVKPLADVFARGKMEDSMPLHTLMGTANSPGSSQLLIDTTLHPGDVLFCPAGFPHTTSTVVNEDNEAKQHDQEGASVHLTLGLDHHIWELDYLQARRLALKRSNVVDSALGQTKDTDNPFVGRVNELPWDVLVDILAELPLGLLDELDDLAAQELVEQTARELERVSQKIDAETANAVGSSVWAETIQRIRQQGLEIFDTHRDMYLAALEEGRVRKAERAMTAHLGAERSCTTTPMTPERIQRLSVFRVKAFYDRINESKASLKAWSLEAAPSNTPDSSQGLPENWQFTLPIKVGDEVEADLGGAFFPARVTRASGGTYDVSFFDGDAEFGLERRMLKLMKAPTSPGSTIHGVDTSSMTKKEIKKWKKEQEKLQKKK